MSRAGHDAYDANGDVQIKMTAGKSVAMYAECMRLVVIRVVSPQEAEIVYDGPGAPAWTGAGKVGKNGQRVVSLARLRALPTIYPRLKFLDEFKLTHYRRSSWSRAAGRSVSA